jgi:hypothetical protein
LKLGDETETLSLATSKSAAVPLPSTPQNAIPGAAPAVSASPPQIAATVNAGQSSANNFGAGGAFGRPQTGVPMPPSPVPGQTGNVPLPAVAGSNSGPVPIQNDAGGIPTPNNATNNPATNLPEPTAARRRRFQNLPQ